MPLKRQIRLKTAIILPFVLIFLFTILAMAAVQTYRYEQTVKELSTKQLSYLTDSISQRLSDFLDRPFFANQMIAYNVGFHHLYQRDDASKIEDFIRAASQPIGKNIQQIDVLGFGGINGEYVGLRKDAPDQYSLMLKDERTENKLVIYQSPTIDEKYHTIIDNYDPRVRPWYAPIAEKPSAQWSAVYTNVDEKQEITLSALSPVFQDATFVGVMVSDVKLNTFNQFLAQLKQRINADVYVIDSQHRLIAHSNDSSVVSWGTELSPKGERLLAVENPNPIIKSSAEQLNEQNLNSDMFTTHVANQRYFNKISAFTDQYGLAWYISVSIAEADLLGSLPENQKTSWMIGLAVSLIGLLIGLMTLNRVANPIISTASAARQLANGNWSASMPKPGQIYETSLLVQAFVEMTNNLKTSFKALRTQLVHDSLTQLLSREGLVENCNQLPQLNGGLLLIGIDKFRDINDSLGHHQADQLLIAIAQRLNLTFPSPARIARIGGDEFAIYLPETNQQDDLKLIATNILKLFASPFSMPSDNIAVNVSIGIVSLEETNMTAWLRNGSIALSNAKVDRTRISLYSPEMANASRKRMQMVTQIKLALDNHEFVPFYQPIVDLHSGEVLGAEALARWISPELGLIPPMEFIPIAEESGLINAIGEQILRQACIDTVRGIQENKWPASFHMHVNLSVNQLSHPDFMSQLYRILEKSQLPPSNLTLEITESRIVDNDPVILHNMLELKKAGIHIAIDDFGTGYSSLAYLHKLPFDCLKIDREFIAQLNTQNIENSVVAAIVNMTRGFKVELVAEGVETQEQVDLLTQLNCPHGQGFLFSKPIAYQDWPTNLVNMK
ncbi:bifunctional diguanylate cyclase/phosphodiesterase [Vibrio metoecus]|uniref:bifunctional diguanylate cyclase/phosphodiesterase n=1 Tax=Vibrio metoecus TaxID=1481663 RepID=UPI00189F19F4|nr:GGDEF and EAL domain-containing protein [Vibrio metoecus]